mgnify:FL=1
MNEEDLLSTATEIGVLLLENGAEIYRVEESVIRILQAYGVEEADVFAIPSCLITTVSVDGKNHTKLCRVYSRRTDLDRVERYNNLCRRICRQTPDRKEILRALGEIKGRPVYRLPMQSLAFALSASAFTLFFGGNWMDALCAAAIGALTKPASLQLEKFHTNPFFANIMLSGMTAALALLSVWAGAGQHVDKIVIGAFMNLVPGVAFTNSLRDIIAGDLIAGLTRLTEALLTALAMALGAGIVMTAAKWGGAF